MTLAATAQQALGASSCARVPPPFLALAEVADRMHCTLRWAQRLCEEKWSGLGLAKKFAGVWGVHPRADQRLLTDRDQANRDLRQLAAIRAAKVRPRHIEIAECRRDIVRGLAAFRLKVAGKPPREIRRLYVGQLIADGRIGEGRPIKKLSVSRLYILEELYGRDGDDGGLAALVPEYDRRSRRPEDCSIGDQAWQAFLVFKNTGHRATVREAYKLTAGLIELEHKGEEGWQWPSYRSVLIEYKKRVGLAERVLNDEGPYKFMGRCLPKVSRSLEDVPAGSHLCGDERTFDFMARAAGGDRTWRRVRLKVTAWMDVRSRYFAGWHIGESANSDTILSAFRLAVETLETLPDEVTIDNGRDYRTVAGRARRDRRWDEFDPKRINSAFERLSIGVHYALVKHPWSKPIESRFSTVAERFDKWFASYWGGRVDQKPWDADRWTRENIECLPTVEEVRDAWIEFLATLHEESIVGDGSFGLCPRELLKRFFTTAPRVTESQVLELCCSRMHGPVKVGRDGIRHQSIIYGKLDHDVWQLQGREVWFLADPVNADSITVCDRNGVPICRAFADRNLGLTRDEVRAAEAMRRAATKTVKKYADARDTLLHTTPQRIARLRRAAAEAQRSSRPAAESIRPAAESIRVVRPDVAAGAERVRKAEGMRALRSLNGINAAAEAANQPRRLSFADLAASGAADSPVDSTPVRSVSLAELSAINQENGDAP